MQCCPCLLLPTLLHIPYKLGPFSNCVLIYEWFYNLFYNLFIPPFSLHLLLPSSFHISSIRPRCRPQLSIHHILFFTYLLLNILLVTTIHYFNLPLSCLGIIPTSLLSATYKLRRPSFKPTMYPTCSNYSKLCYLTAW